MVRLAQHIERDREIGREFWLEDEGVDVAKLRVPAQPRFYVLDGLFLNRAALSARSTPVSDAWRRSA